MAAVDSERVEPAREYQVLDYAPIYVFHSNALQEVEDVREVPVFIALCDYRVCGGIADALDGRKAEAYRARAPLKRRIGIGRRAPTRIDYWGKHLA